MANYRKPSGRMSGKSLQGSPQPKHGNRGRTHSQAFRREIPKNRSVHPNRQVRTIDSCPPGKTFRPLPGGQVDTIWDGEHTIIDIVNILDGKYGY